MPRSRASCKAQSQTTINGRMVVEAIKWKLSEITKITVKFSLVIHRRQRYCGDFNLLFVYLSWTHYVFLPLLFFKVLSFFCKTRKKGKSFVCAFFSWRIMMSWKFLLGLDIKFDGNCYFFGGNFRVMVGIISKIGTA